jgi:hypothetical protein
MSNRSERLVRSPAFRRHPFPIDLPPEGGTPNESPNAKNVDLKLRAQGLHASHHFVRDGLDIRRRFSFVSVAIELLKWFQR